MPLLFALLLSGSLDLDSRRRGDLLELEAHWVGPEQEEHQVRYALDRAAAREARAESIRFPWRDYVDVQLAAVAAYASLYPDLIVSARPSRKGRGLSITVRGAGERRYLERVMHGVREEAEQAASQYRARHDIVEHQPGLLRPDHVRIAARAVPHVRPAAEALKRQAGSRDAFLRLALSYVQAMPYERREGFRRPLSALALNKGDCETKSVLYLALVRAAYPELELAMVYIHEHTYVAINLPRPTGRTTLSLRGRSWTVAEPVGPAKFDLGELGPESADRPVEGVELLPR